MPRRRRGGRGRPPRPRLRRLGRSSRTTPAKPMTKPAALRSVIRSPGTKTCASGSTRSGTTAMVIPAKPELTRSWPQASSAKGSAFEKTPIPRQWSQMRRPTRVDRGGRPVPEASATAARMTAAMPIRAAAIVSGPKPVSAFAMPRKDPPQVSPRRKSRSQARAEGAGRDMPPSLPGIARRGQSQPCRRPSPSGANWATCAPSRRRGHGRAPGRHRRRRLRRAEARARPAARAGRGSPSSTSATTISSSRCSTRWRPRSSPPPRSPGRSAGSSATAREVTTLLGEVHGVDRGRREVLLARRRRACPTTPWCSRPARGTPISATTSGSPPPPA